MDRNIRALAWAIIAAIALSLSACGMTPEEEKQLSSEGHFMDGMAAFNQKDYAKARDLFQAALAEDKNNQKAANALAWAENAIKEKGGNGVALDGQEDPEASLEDKDVLAQSVPPDDETAQLLSSLGLGMEAYYRGDYAGLLAASEDALQHLDPSNPLYNDVLRARLLGLVMTEDYAGGADAVTDMLNAGQGDDPALLNVATLTYERSGDLDSAVWAAEQAYQIDPTHPDSQNNLAYTYAQTGANLDYALALAQQSLMTNPSSPAYLDTLGWVLYRSGDPAGAIPYIQQALDLTPPGRDRDEIASHYQAVAEHRN
jgi:tetratricopeptide (TPR) repeat protein